MSSNREHRRRKLGMISIVLTIIFMHLGFSSFSQQNNISGKVFVKEKGKKVPLTGVNIYWENSKIGTTSDIEGNYVIEKIDEAKPKLIFSFIGYNADTIAINGTTSKIDIELKSGVEINEVMIAGEKALTTIDRMNTINTQNISGAELKRAACCNLSESFETNASVDVTYSDAVTGAKQIKMLGLSGKYVQTMTEIIPNLGGIATLYGLTYIPGSWMSSISVSKGASSVTSGYEGITGQINAGYKEPDSKERFYLNMLANHEGKTEGNINGSIKVNDKLSTIILGHYEKMHFKKDMNNDGFIDFPLITMGTVMNKWKYDGGNMISRFGFKYLNEERLGGQMKYDKTKAPDVDNGYGINILSERFEAFAKVGYTFKSNTNRSLATFFQYTNHNQDGTYGLKKYDGRESKIYTNANYQIISGKDDNKLNFGADYKYNNTIETYNQTGYNLNESVPGVYAQYLHNFGQSLQLMGGARYDYHNLYGNIYSLRFHSKYNVTEFTSLKASIGNGHRTANVLTENAFLMASGRTIDFLETPDLESAVNMGATLIHDLIRDNRKTTFTAEVYHTNFQNQVMIDIMTDPSKMYVYNLDGKSYATNYQVEINSEVIRHLHVTAAFRYTDSKATYSKVLLDVPFVNRYKGLLSLSYATKLKKWQFDYTLQANGGGKLPSKAGFPEQYQVNDSYPSFYLMNAQVTKFFKTWNIYGGVENATNFKQEYPIIGYDDPFGKYFDASTIWAPLAGRMFYLGFRYIFEKYDN